MSRPLSSSDVVITYASSSGLCSCSETHAATISTELGLPQDSRSINWCKGGKIGGRRCWLECEGMREVWEGPEGCFTDSKRSDGIESRMDTRVEQFVSSSQVQLISSSLIYLRY